MLAETTHPFNFDPLRGWIDWVPAQLKSRAVASRKRLICRAEAARWPSHLDTEPERASLTAANRRHAYPSM